MNTAMALLGIILLGGCSGHAVHIKGPGVLDAGFLSGNLTVQLQEGAEYLRNPCHGVTMQAPPPPPRE